MLHHLQLLIYYYFFYFFCFNASPKIFLFVNISFVMGGGQNLKRRNVDRLVFRNFEIANIQIKKDELSDHLLRPREVDKLE